MTRKVVPDGPDLPLIPITSHTRKGAEWLMAQINATSMHFNVLCLIFMVTSSLFDFEYKQCVDFPLERCVDGSLLKSAPVAIFTISSQIYFCLCKFLKAYSLDYMVCSV